MNTPMQSKSGPSAPDRDLDDRAATRRGLPVSFNRALVLEAIALIVFAGLVIAFVHSVVPYLAD
jgi:hypothetical protein